MCGLNTTAMSWAMLAVILASQQAADSQEAVPVVSLHQPFSYVSAKAEEESELLRTYESVAARTSPVVVPAKMADTTSIVTLAPVQAALDVNPTCGTAANGVGAVAVCGPTCSTCGGTGECDTLFTAPGGVNWSTCANGCQNGCAGEAGCRGERACRGTGCGGSCGSACIDWTCMDLCCRQGFWIRADALMWWSKDDQIPTLVTSSPLGTPIDDVGVLGLPTTSELFNNPLFDDLRLGGRLRFGLWATDCKYGLDGSLWGVENESDEVSWSSAGDPAYARPFFNADPLVNAPDAELVSFDATLDGTVTVNSSSEILGGDLGLRYNVKCCSDFCGLSSSRLDVYAGYRYFKVREGVRITENLESIAFGGPIAQGTTIDLFDDFHTRNEFHGANLGIVAASQLGRWTAEVSSRIALGQLTRQVAISGQTTVTVPSLVPGTRTGGVLAQPTNIGNYEDREFAILPEVRADLGYNVNCHTKLLVGYSFMYLGDVVRPGDIMDPTVNGLQLDPTLPLVGPERPQFSWNDSNMWLMGINLGVEYSF